MAKKLFWQLDRCELVGQFDRFKPFKLFICGGPEMAPALPQWRTTVF